MSRAQCIAERELVLVPHLGKMRPGIVIEIQRNWTVIAMLGTGTPRDLPRVEVRPETRDGKALGFYKPTYFYATNKAVAATDELTPTGRLCPPLLFDKLCSLAGTKLR